MIRSLYFAVVIAVFLTSEIKAALVQLEGSVGPQPFSVSYSSTATEPLSFVLQILNDTETTLNALIWQLELELVGIAGSTAEVFFEEPVSPPNGLFDPIPGPISLFFGTNSHLLIFDGDLLSGTGRQIFPGEARNIVELFVSAQPGATGDFELRMRGFDPIAPTEGSSLLESEESIPKSFANGTAAIGGTFLLGTISISDVPEPSATGIILGCIFVTAFWARK